MSDKATIYNNFKADKDKGVQGLAFMPKRPIQSAELNELQSVLHAKGKRVNDYIFADGDVVDGGQARLDIDTGLLSLDAGSIYIAGSIYSVDSAALTIAVAGEINIGVWLTESYRTELDDERHYNPAVGSRTEGEAGAYRTVGKITWGLSDDDRDGDFYNVFTAKDGYLNAKEPPPQTHLITQSLAKYDRDSAGGMYVISGLNVQVAPDLIGQQSYVVDAGRAKVNGFSIEYPTARRFNVTVIADEANVDGEPHLADGSTQKLTLNRYPISQVNEIRITSEKTVNVTHANYLDSEDLLPDATVVEILEVKQGATTYVANTDYQLITGKVDWSLSGAEPSAGSTYQVTYKYIHVVSPIAQDLSSVTVANAVAGTQIIITYHYYKPRIDRLCVGADGDLHLVQGVPGAHPLPPHVPDNLLLLATIYQKWDNKTRRIVLDGVRLVPMDELNQHAERLDYITEMLAQTRLEQTAGMQEAGRKRGLFADPFLSDEFRDQGRTQTAIIADGQLQLPLLATSHFLDIGSAVTLTHSDEVYLSQSLGTECMKINPYMAFEPLPLNVSISPSVDRWTLTDRVVTQTLTVWGWSNSSKETVIGSTTKTLSYLRRINIKVQAKGFGVGEKLKKITFDGIDVTPRESIVASSSGQINTTIKIPNRVPAGRKAVTVTGVSGNTGSAIFVGEGKSVRESILRTIVRRRRVDPLAQTFMLDEDRELSAVDLYMCAIGSKDVRVQIRETTVGMPNDVVLGETQLNKSDLNTTAASRFIFDQPILLSADQEYAIIVMSDEATPSVKVAKLGGFDSDKQQWVTAQPYHIGVLLSSSNASTWTAHQGKDLTFKLLTRKYSEINKTVALGAVEMLNDTDLRIHFDAELPHADTDATVTATLPDGSKYTLSDGQSISLNTPSTGSVTFQANLKGSKYHSPVLHPHVQVLTGQLQSTANYISRAIPAGLNSRVRVLIDAFIPTSATVNAQAINTELMDGSSWQDLTIKENQPIDSGWREITLETTNHIDANNIAVQLNLAGSASARPLVKNCRILVIEGV